MLCGRFSVVRWAVTVFVAMLVALPGTAQMPASAVAAADVPTTCQTDKPRSAYPTYSRDGNPLANAPIGQGNYFSYPNASSADRGAIMNRVINTINSTWGTYYRPVRLDQPETCTEVEDADGKYLTYQKRQGTIRMSTWTFNHGGVRDALVRAEQRGASVQIIAAAGVNRTGVNDAGPNKPWFSVRNYLRTQWSDTRSNAWECSGACRGSGGAPHSKYFLFTDVGSSHISNIVVQSSMNLTPFAVSGQWNQATAMWRNTGVHADFLRTFNQSTPLYEGGGYYARSHGSVTNIFFPKGGAADPVLAALGRVRCAGGTRVRVIQYAIHGTRGNAIAKKLRGLWNSGCNVAVIYSVSSRPVLTILRSRSGRGRVPVKQSVIKNRQGEIVKYNHSKWLAIAGNYAGSSGAWMAHAGSANWSDIAYSSDEQMQQLSGYSWVRPYFSNFDRTWRQKSSKTPSIGRSHAGGRMLRATPQQPTYGSGIYKHMSEGE